MRVSAQVGEQEAVGGRRADPGHGSASPSVTVPVLGTRRIVVVGTGDAKIDPDEWERQQAPHFSGGRRPLGFAFSTST
jgi:hypothetical protein